VTLERKAGLAIAPGYASWRCAIRIEMTSG
jgi:hypothetical protein